MTDDASLLQLMRAIAASDAGAVTALLAEAPHLAGAALREGATRADAVQYYLKDISHYVYAGDTALHVAAAAHHAEIVCRLLRAGAAVDAVNRRGAGPLHYAADGTPGLPRWNPGSQAETIALLIAAGADPNATDRSGVGPLHRAVRTRCAAAVETLLAGGASPVLRNGSGLTPMDLATRTTGRGGSGSAAARAEQARIIARLEAAARAPLPE